MKDDYKNNLNVEIIFKDESIFKITKDVEYVFDTMLVKHYEIDGINDLIANMEGNILVDSLVTADFIISTRQNVGKQWILENRTLESIIKIDDAHISKNINLDLYIITISNDRNNDGVNLEKWILKESGDFKKEVLVRSVDDIKKYGFWDSNIYFNEDGNKLIEYLNSERRKSSIRELSEVISRGKTVNPQEYVEEGNYKVLNIGDIQTSLGGFLFSGSNFYAELGIFATRFRLCVFFGYTFLEILRYTQKIGGCLLKQWDIR